MTPFSEDWVPKRERETALSRMISWSFSVTFIENIDENNSLTTYSLQVLELCRLLWGPVAKPANVQLLNPAYFDEQRRRQMLSHWLDQCILSQPQPQVSRSIDRACAHLFCLAMGDAELWIPLSWSLQWMREVRPRWRWPSVGLVSSCSIGQQSCSRYPSSLCSWRCKRERKDSSMTNCPV